MKSRSPSQSAEANFHRVRLGEGELKDVKGWVVVIKKWSEDLNGAER